MLNQNNSESFDTYNTCANDLKKQILKDGIWKPYADRLKNLLISQEKLWELYGAESNFENKRLVLEDIINLQSVIASWYSATKKIIEFGVNSEAQK